jgi:DnaA-homolog protein
MQRPMKQIPLAMAFDVERSFESFIGGSNRSTIEQFRNHLPVFTCTLTPMYVWGPSGSGKTHLLRALVQQHQLHGSRVGWFDASTPLPWAHDEAWTLVVLDDCQAFNAAQQHAAFALFVEAASHGTSVVAAGRVPPIDLPLRDDLRTRLGWGLVLTLHALSEADTRAALRREADRRGLFLSDEVMGYLLTRFERDLRSLMALFERLDEFAWVNKRAITLPALKQMLLEATPPALPPT